jgi:E3 ubiquitin-protein ligase ZNF598
MSASDLANLSPADRARLVRHGAVIERASNLLGSNPSKINAFRYNISSYRSGARSATQLIDAFSTLFSETSDTALGSLVREVADLFDDAGKADALRKALHDRRAALGGAEGSVQEDYPSLPTLGGMHGATTSTSGWAAAASANAPSAANHTASPSTRVLRLKHSTRLGGPSTSSSSVTSTPSSRDPSGRTVPGATWTAPSRPAALTLRPQVSASAAFPALPSAAASKSSGPSSSWVNVSGGASASTLASRVGGSIGGSSNSNSNSAGRYASLSASNSGTSTPLIGARREDAFPALPAAPKPPPPSVFGYGRKAVRRDLGAGNKDTGFSWGGEGAEASSSSAPAEAEDEAGKGKKKGRQGKKVLVQWG